MYTYQDLIKVGDSEAKRGEFCASAVDMFKASADYRTAQTAEAYYNKHNTTIEKFQKVLYTMSGNKKEDIFSANYKLKTLFFRRLVIQQVQYVLGNGVTLGESKNKEKLGKDFDFKLQTVAKKAMVGGRAFGFWNYDHLEVFSYADTPTEAGFYPLYDETNAQLKAGIRFWQRKLGENNHYWFTLYEEDGVTEFHKIQDGKVAVVKSKYGYKRTVVATNAGGIENQVEENYGKLPIIPLYANDSHESEITGVRESIDAYDLIKSGLANVIDDTAEVYWLIQNAGGMDDSDIAMLLQRLKTMHGAGTEDDATIQPYTVNTPFEARKTMLEILRKDIYEDFQSLDVNTLSASAKTTQEIQSAYQAQDNKCADFEYYVIDFVQKVLELAGIKDNPTFTWNRVVNQNEQTQMILSASNYLSEEMIIKKLPFLTPEEANLVIKQREAEGYSQFNALNQPQNDETEVSE